MKKKESLREQSCPRSHGLILSFSWLPALSSRAAFSIFEHLLSGTVVGGVCGGEEVAKCRVKRHSVSPGLGFLTCNMMSRTRNTPVQSL